MNIINYLKKHKVFIFASISSLFIIFILIKINISQKDNKETIDKDIDNIAEFKSIQPGEVFNEDEINNLLGYPTNSTSEGKIKINYYRSTNEYRTNQLQISDNKIELIKESINPVDNKDSSFIRNQFGIADIILYEKSPNSFFDLYVYLNSGIAYLGHKDEGIFEIWYFPPTTLEDFINNYAQNYQEEPFTQQEGY